MSSPWTVPIVQERFCSGTALYPWKKFSYIAPASLSCGRCQPTLCLSLLFTFADCGGMQLTHSTISSVRHLPPFNISANAVCFAKYTCVLFVNGVFLLAFVCHNLYKTLVLLSDFIQTASHDFLFCITKQCCSCAWLQYHAPSTGTRFQLALNLEVLTNTLYQTVLCYCCSLVMINVWSCIHYCFTLCVHSRQKFHNNYKYLICSQNNSILISTGLSSSNLQIVCLSCIVFLQHFKYFHQGKVCFLLNQEDDCLGGLLLN
jgi:hypothetical protein